MRAASLETDSADLDVAALAGAFAERGARQDAAAHLAHLLGGDYLVLFAPDPDLGVLLPAPGLRQTLPHAAAWRAFLDQCVRDGSASGRLPGPNGESTAAQGLAEGDAVAVLIGAQIEPEGLGPLRSLLPLLGALFQTERRVEAGEVHARAANEAVERSRTLSRSLDEMRRRLELALREAEASRGQARERAQHAELLAEELQTQAAHLQEQASELEILNEALAARTEEAEKSRQAADEANRAKSEFLANMSHELRTPINAVLGFEELLALEIAGPLNDGQRSHLERIRSSSRHLLTLINDILDLAKVEAGQLSVVRDYDTLADVLSESVALVQGQYTDREIALEHGCPDPAPEYYGDRDRVRQIVINLLSNAGKFTEPGGAVTVSCGTTDQPDGGAALKGAARWTYVHVEDTGIGIDADDLANIFQPFKQVEHGRTRTQGGTGLGLTISRQLARLMGGDLTVHSEFGVGSRFSLWLPSDRPIEGEIDPTIRIPEK